MMNLRQLSSHHDDPIDPTQSWSHFSSIRFNPAASELVGNIGECLDLGEGSEPFGEREWYELDEVDCASGALDIGFSSTGAVYGGEADA